MSETFRVRSGGDVPGDAEGLTEVLLDVVAAGASVGFMHPLSRERALGYWQGVLASAARGERVLRR
jgi:hypothetical protein